MSSPSGSNMDGAALQSGVNTFTSNNLTRVSQELEDSFKYCNPLEWRKWCRGPQVLGPVLPGTFPFFSLPAELRNEVYRELLLTDLPLQLVHDRPSWPDASIPGKQLHPAIMRVNKAAWKEAAPILYGENTFYLHMDNTLSRYEADMQRQDTDFRMPPPITTYMAQIKRIVMHAGSQDRTRTRYELYRQMLNIGIQMDGLQVFAIQFSDDYLLEKNQRVNVEWLEELPVEELKKRCTWFSPGMMTDDGWLVMKKGKGDGSFVGRIPGLGFSG